MDRMMAAVFCVLALMVVGMVFVAYHENERVRGLMKECMKDYQEYECYSMLHARR